MSSYYIHCAPQQIVGIKKPTLGGLSSRGWIKQVMVDILPSLKEGACAARLPVSRGSLYRVPPVHIKLRHLF